tara:strand:+ start:692 stop:958 length:267 start_codon:yes stop_codon:yes gene_type:complete
MKIDIEKLKKKILYRSQYRGTREMDKLLYSFVSDNINDMNEVKLLSLEKFLDIEDEKLYRFYNNIDQDLQFEDEYILSLFKKFKFNIK